MKKKEENLSWENHHEITSVVEWALDVEPNQELDIFVDRVSGVTLFTGYFWSKAMKRLLPLFGDIEVELDATHKNLRVSLDYPKWKEIMKRYKKLEKKWNIEERE